MVIRSSLLYGAEYWPIKKSHIQRITVVEMRMISWTCRHTRFDKIRNEVIKGKIAVVSIKGYDKRY